MFNHLDFPRLFLCESTGYSKHKTTAIASVAICGGSNHILTGLWGTERVKVFWPSLDWPGLVLVVDGVDLPCPLPWPLGFLEPLLSEKLFPCPTYGREE